MDYTALLEIAYENIMDCDIQEVTHYVNIKDNLLALKKENPILIKVETGNEISDYLFRECLEADLSYFEFEAVRITFETYMRFGFRKEEALTHSLTDVLANFNNNI